MILSVECTTLKLFCLRNKTDKNVPVTRRQKVKIDYSFVLKLNCFLYSLPVYTRKIAQNLENGIFSDCMSVSNDQLLCIKVSQPTFPPCEDLRLVDGNCTKNSVLPDSRSVEKGYTPRINIGNPSREIQLAHCS